jgi:HD-GYP domain-containing protein (c-di-GMP phosphodiesterase class II)
VCRRGFTSPEWGTPVPATRTARVSIQERQAFPLSSQLTSEPHELRTLARRYFAHDFEGQTHARNVARLALRIASGFPLAREDLLAIAVGATLHDIGKLTVPAAVLETPGVLTSSEWALVRTHPARGDLLVSPHVRHPVIRSVIRWHHERVDGAGYPDRLRGEEIPLSARIVAVADAYEALVAARPYSAPRPPADALAEIVDCAGSQFDADCVRRLVELDAAARNGLAL